MSRVASIIATASIFLICLLACILTLLPKESGAQPIVNSGSSRTTNITIEAWLTDSVYLKGESIFLLFRRINSTPYLTSFPRVYPMHNLNLELQNSNGQAMRHTGTCLNITGPYSRTRVEPSDTVLDLTNLLFEFGDPVFARSLLNLLPPDRYSLTIRYFDDQLQEREYLIKIDFRVSEPPEYESKAYEAFIMAESIRLAQGRQAARQQLSSFIDQFPDSRYFPGVCRLLSILDGAKVRQWSRLLIDRFPDSGNAWLAVVLYTGSLPTPQREAEWVDLAARHRGTLVEECIKTMRKANYQRAGDN